jgi:GxxExxY protein
MELIFREEVYQIVGACMEVFKDKGQGFVEPVYQNCLEIELAHQRIPFDAQRSLDLFYRNERLKCSYIPDLVCYNRIIVELKAVKCLTDDHRKQLLNYLKATDLEVGLLVNFGNPNGLEWERMVRSKK